MKTEQIPVHIKALEEALEVIDQYLQRVVGNLPAGTRFKFKTTSRDIHEVIGTKEDGLILCRNTRTYATSHQDASTKVIPQP